jgi:hypothetical protein
VITFDKPTTKEVGWGGYPQEAWDKDSCALIASNGKGEGVILFTGGPHVRYELEEGCCSAYLCDYGLDDAPAGLSVWEGKYLLEGNISYNDADGDITTQPKGKFRPLTDLEWEHVKNNKSPWDETYWMLNTEEM